MVLLVSKVSYTVLYYHYAFYLQMLLQIFPNASREMFLSILVYASGSNVCYTLPYSPILYHIQSTYSRHCRFHNAILSGIYSTKLPSCVNLVLKIFIRDEIRKKLLHRGFLLILKLFPFSKSCSQVSHLIIKDLK